MHSNEPPRFPRDLGYVDLYQGAEVLYWCKELSCNEELLRNVVQEVGPSVVEVKRSLWQEPKRG